MLELMMALAQDPAAVPDGRQLAEGQTCYTLNMTREAVTRPIGVTWQSVERTQRDGRPVLDVVVHQSVNGGAFNMRDEFVLDATTLRPIALTNRRNGAVHVRLAYSDDRITGERIEADGRVTPIDVPLDGPVWDGNLFGLTFAALPLAEGSEFSLPYWQYDKGFGQFTIRVTGSQRAGPASDPVDAWVVEAAAGESPPLTYLIGKADHQELSYTAAQGSQTPGGDCSELVAAS